MEMAGRSRSSMLPPRKPPFKAQAKRKTYPKGHFTTRDLAKLMDRRRITLCRVLGSANELLTSVWKSAHELLERMERLTQKWERMQTAENDDRAVSATGKTKKP